METLQRPLILTTVYLLVYAAVSQVTTDVGWRLTLMLFSLSPLPVLWLVWRVLRDDYAAPHTFDERFYADGPFRTGAVPVKDREES